MENFTKASAGNRFLALLIDLLVSYVPIILFGIVSTNLIALGYVASVAYTFTKDALPFLGGQSIGKKAIGIKVVLTETGQMITGNYTASVLRQLPTIIPIFNLIDAFMVLTSESLRFGDKWAGTMVVKA